MNFFDKIKNAAKGRMREDLADSHDEKDKSGTSEDTSEQSAVKERLERLKTLTVREREVYCHLLKGLKMREIASLMGVSYSTVNFHCKGLYKKLGINTRAQLFLQYAPLNRELP
jgi:RNA polymerase sigma factor (sigma-70 family)